MVLCCAWLPAIAAGIFDDGEARKQIAIERQRVEELRGEIRAQQALQQAADARIGKLEEALKSQGLLDLFTQIESLKLEVSRLRGQIEVLNNSVDNAVKRQRDLYLDLDTRLRRIEQQGTPAAQGPAPAAPSPAAAPQPAAGASPAAAATPSALKPAVPPVAVAPAAVPPAATAPAAVDSGAEMRAYEAAQNQRRIGNYQGAIAAFQNFIKQYPKSNLAPRAQYWIGDSYFNLRNYKLALASQQALISGYPDSPSVPDAMLNIASSQIEMGEAGAGRRTLEDLVSRYPVSDAAEKAKRRLAALNTPAAAGRP